MGQGLDVSLLDARRDEQGPGDGARAGAPEATGAAAGEAGPTAVPLLALGAAALAVRTWRSPGPPEERRPHFGWWSLGAVGVLALVWLPPALDMVMHSPVWKWARQGWGLVVTFGAVLATVIVSIMRTTGPVADYRLRYTWVPPVLAAVAVLWALWLAAARRWPRAERVLLPGVLAGGLALAAVTSVSGARPEPPTRTTSRWCAC